jgi:hypothetical protein
VESISNLNLTDEIGKVPLNKTSAWRSEPFGRYFPRYKQGGPLQKVGKLMQVLALEIDGGVDLDERTQ